MDGYSATDCAVQVRVALNAVTVAAREQGEAGLDDVVDRLHEALQRYIAQIAHEGLNENEAEIATSSHAERVFGVPAYLPPTGRTAWAGRDAGRAGDKRDGRGRAPDERRSGGEE